MASTKSCWYDFACFPLSGCSNAVLTYVCYKTHSYLAVLTDMDDKILEMLDLIKEDGDSFAMRAQMFYQRKPKLGELIEQIYKTYRALAERYDHASGALHQVRDSVSKDSDLLDTDTNELDVEKFISKISNLQESVSQSEIEIENLKQCLGRAEAERDDAVGKYKVAESEVERLQVAVIDTRQEKEDVEAALKKLQNVHRNSAKQLRVCTSEIQLRHQVIDDLDDKIKNSKEDSVSPFSSKLKDQNLRLRDIAKNLEADIEHQVKYQNSLHQEIDRLKIEVDETKEKFRVLEQSQQPLISEKALLVSRLEIADDANWKLELKCSVLQNALSESNSKLEAFRSRLKGLEASWPILLHDKFSLIAEKEALEGKCKELENNREDLKVKKPRFLPDFDEERIQHSSIVSDMEIQILQLKNTVQDLENRSSILSSERWKLVEVCGSFEKRLLDLEEKILKCESELNSLSGDLYDQTLESAIERSVLYSVVAQMGVDQSERMTILEKQTVGVSSELRKMVAEREKESSSLVQNMVLGSIRESLLEYQMKELIEAHHSSRESKATEIQLLHERINLLEGQNVRLSSVLASGYITAEEDSPNDILRVRKELTPNSWSSSTQEVKHPRAHDHEKTTFHSKNGSRTKDIVLDHVISECEAADDGMLELWETSNGGGTIDLKVGIRSRNHRRVADCNFSRESLCLSEKVPLDSLVEVSEYKASKRRSGRMIHDRLGTDLQKLTNLQITLKDLKRKVSSNPYRCDEYDNVKEQLEAVEVAIMTLFDTNQKLTESMQKAIKSSEGDSNGSSSVDSVRDVSDQAWKIGEEIGRQQRKLQSLQWLLVKIDEESKKGRRRSNVGGARLINVPERKPKVLLKDILHVRVKKNLKKKKGQFCACVS